MKKIVVVLICLSFLGCLPAVELDTPLKKIAYAKVTLEGANNSVADLLRAGQITVDEAMVYRDKAERVRIALDLAQKAVEDGQPLDTISAWKLANVLLLEINNYLLEKEAVR